MRTDEHAMKQIVRVEHNPRLCHHCGACVAVCAEEALFLWDGFLEVRVEACSGCRRCIPACPLQALRLVPQAQVCT